MNTIYYANPKTGQRQSVKTARDYKYLDPRSVSWKPTINNPRKARRPTMAEADRAMNAKGFIRWPRKKPLPVAVKKAA